MREQTHPFFVPRGARVAAAPPARCGGCRSSRRRRSATWAATQLIEWGGALRWLVAGARTEPASAARLGAAHGGHATLFRGGDKSAGVFQPLPAPLVAIHRRLKATFDPQGIFNRGRLYAAF